METETTHNNLWPGFRVFFVASIQFIFGGSFMVATFLVAPFYIGTLPSPWRTLVTAIWTFGQSFFHACWLFFIPLYTPPSYPTAVALMILICCWVWSVALIRETFELNGK
jgi:hypothetical protein